jgi:hypothetical protein
MKAPDQAAVLSVLRHAIQLAQRLNVTAEASVLQQFCDRFENEEPTFKLLRGEVDEAIGQAAARIGDCIEDDMGDPLPGKEEFVAERDRIWADFLRLIYPPEWSEMDVSDFHGAEHLGERMVSYKGDPSGVRPVVEGSIAFVRRYSELIARGDFKAAYRLTDVGLQAQMSERKFVSEYERAAKKYGGPALEFVLKQFAYIYADPTARMASNTSKEGWPKLTAKESRRCRVVGFWIRDKAAKTGCAGSLWLSEVDAGYRVATFNFYVP